MTAVRGGLLSVLIAVLFLLIANAAVVWGQKYRALAAQRDSSARLVEFADRLSAAVASELAGLADANPPAPAAGASPDHFAWQARGAEVRFGSEPGDAAVADGVRRSLTEAPGAAVFGPVATQDGVDMLIVKRPANSGAATATGVAISALALMQSSGIVEFVKQGNLVRLSWADNPAADIFRSHVQAMSSPVSTRVTVSGGAWLLQSEPVAGWTEIDEGWPLSLLSALIAFAIGGTFYLLTGKPRELRAEMQALSRQLQYSHQDLETSVKRQAQIESRLQSVTSLDAESGLSNRQAFQQSVSDELKSLRARVGGGLSIVAVRLDNLRRVAGVIGPPRFFSRLAAALEELCGDIRPRPFAARLTDADLAVCLPGQTDPAAMERFAQDLCSTFRGRIEADGEVFDLGPSVGIAIAEDGYQYADEMVQGALLAADEARSDATRDWVLFDPQIREHQTSLLQLEAQIGQAIDEHQFRLFCQPIVRTSDRALKGFETLLRWQHPVEGLLAPGRFLSIAEGSRHMPRLSQWCTDEVIRLAGQWLNLREEPFYLSVNLMASDLERPEFIRNFANRIARAEITSERLRVEVTEREIIKDLSTTARATADLEELGIHVLLDDFGTGFSSLTHLLAFRFHTVKIDRSFISSMEANPRDFTLVKAIVELVHELGMECVAEGVETEQQLRILANIGCDFCQGYLFSRPVPPTQVPELVARFPALTPAAEVVG